MKHKTSILCLVLAIFVIPLFAKTIAFDDNWAKKGFSLISSSEWGVEIVYSMHRFTFGEMTIDGEEMQTVSINSMVLPNDEGAPNLPGMGKYIAIPQGAKVKLVIVSSRKEIYEDIDIAPAPNIPAEVDDSPLKYKKDPKIYQANKYYPEAPIRISDPMKIRGVDVVILGITPFQYNPVSKELIVYTDVRVKLEFLGGTGHFGEDRLRSRWFESVLYNNIMNYHSLSSLESIEQLRGNKGRAGECEYIIIVPDDPDFIAWADTVKYWRKKQGILTDVYKITDPEIGSNTVAAIEDFIDEAYNTWTIPPVSVLLMSDYQSSGKAYGITSPSYPHPYSGTYITDNTYADVDGDGLPEMNFARLTAQNATHLEEMVYKFMDYEQRDPPTDAGFYDHPLMACGWQAGGPSGDRWFQLCTEIVRGFFINKLGKSPVRQYNIYDGNPTPGCAWSTATNTGDIIDYFGPSGLGYVPATNPYDNSWWDSGSEAGITSDINNGTFIVQHRDHGGETGWGEPNYGISSLSGLSNSLYPFVFSINCLTGRFDYASEVFTEAFHRMQYGALGLIAASQISYSFVNDTYVFGYYDGMWPNFDPGNDFSSQQDTFVVNLRPGFGSVSGKYYLEASSWPYNATSKAITYDLFHLHCDAFITLFSEVPESLDVTHNAEVPLSSSSFTVTVQDDYGNVDSALVCCWCAVDTDMWVRGHTNSAGEVTLSINPSEPIDSMWVTVTKYNHFRYESIVKIMDVGVPHTPIVHRLFNYEKYPDLNPIFEFESHDPEGEDLRFCIYWDTDPNFTAPDSEITIGTYPSDTRVTYPLSSTLIHGVTYWWKIRSTDPEGSGYYSGWTTPLSFTVDTILERSGWFQTTAAQFQNCNLTALIIQGDSLVIAMNNSVSLLQQGFEGSTFPPTGWARFAGPANTSSNDWARLTDQWHTGSASAGINYDGSNTVDRFLATSQLNLTGVVNTQLVFWCRDNWASYYVYHGIWASVSSQTNPGDYVEVTSIGPTVEDTWQERTVDLSAYDDNASVYFAFRYNEHDGTDWWVDDVEIMGDAKGDSGKALSSAIAYVDFPDRDGWDQALWTKATEDDSIRLQLDYLSGGGWALIPDGDLPDNSTGFFTGTANGIVDISDLDTTVYDTLRLRATLYKKGGKSPTDPSLIDWEVGVHGIATWVFMSEFIAVGGKGRVALSWRTESESNNVLWIIERSRKANDGWQEIATVEGQGTKPTPTEYEYVDDGMNKDGEYFYRLIAVDGTGEQTVFGPVSATVRGKAPRVFALHKLSPNPCGGRLAIRYDIPKSTFVSLKVYNVVGQVVRTLVHGRQDPDYYNIIWNGKNDYGRMVGFGVYFVRLDTDRYAKTRKLLVVK